MGVDHFYEAKAPWKTGGKARFTVDLSMTAAMNVHFELELTYKIWDMCSRSAVGQGFGASVWGATLDI